MPESPEPLELEAFVALHESLLELERRSEVEDARRLRDELPEAELERRGVTIRRLVLRDSDVGLGGRTLLVLESPDGRELPAHRISPGDVVALRGSGTAGRDAVEVEGVVASLRQAGIVVAVDDDADDVDLPPRLRLDRLAPDVTFRRMRDALRALRRDRRDDAHALRQVLLDRRPPDAGPKPTADALTWFDESLDPSQREAIAFALRSRDVALIHGPPGTGKTTAIVELIRQAIARGERVLATAPSNVAVDNLVERLARHGVRLVRIGHPARLLPAVREHSLDALVERSGDRRLTKALRRDIDRVHRRMARATDRRERRELRQEIRGLRAELRVLEDATVRQIVDSAEVVLTTTTGADDRALGERCFDLVVVDEAAQALEAACWIPLHRGRRAVLAGDHRQLAPTILSRDAERRGLARTLFERIAERHGERVLRMLTVQYRMHEAIMSWSSAAMYDGRLEAAPAVRDHRLSGLARPSDPGATGDPLTDCPFLLLDTAGCGLEESAEDHDGSKSNDGEVRIVLRHVEALLEAGVPPDSIGVITPYHAQVQALRAALGTHPAIEVATVDGFQGREKEAIVLSLVRSNERGEVGFLADARRLNVAITRARRQVAIVGDTATLCCDAFLAGIVDHAQRHGEHRSAWELID